MHPIKERKKMLIVHHFFSVLDYSKTKKKLSFLEQDLDNTCRELASAQPTQKTSAIPSNIIFELCAGDQNCMCKDESTDAMYQAHSGLILPGRENTWLQHIGIREFQAGFIETHTPTNTMQSSKINVTDHFRYIQQTTGMHANRAVFLGGFVQYSLLLGLHLFVDVELIVSEEIQKVEGTFMRYQFINHLPTEVTIAEQRLQPAAQITMLVIVDGLGRNISEFVSSNLDVLDSQDSAVKALFVAVGDMKIAASVSQAVSSSFHHKSNAEMVSYTGVASWLKGVKAGIARLPEDALVFISDTSINIKLEFLNRCRKLLSGYIERLYQPIPGNCLSVESNCDGSKSTSQNCRFLLGNVSELRSWLDRTCSDSKSQSIFLATAVEPLLSFSTPVQECCHHPHLFCN